MSSSVDSGVLGKGCKFRDGSSRGPDLPLTLTLTLTLALKVRHSSTNLCALHENESQISSSRFSLLVTIEKKNLFKEFLDSTDPYFLKKWAGNREEREWEDMQQIIGESDP